MKKIKCTVEIPSHSYIKYEVDKISKVLTVDRILDIPYPANYGYVNNTLWDDGDALDVFITGLGLHPTSEVQVYPFAVIEMTDNGVSDTKLIASFFPRAYNRSEAYKLILNFLQKYKKGIVIKSISIREKDIETALKKGYGNYNNDSNDEFKYVGAGKYEKS